MQSLSADQQETIWSVAYTETLDQAAEIEGVGDDLWTMAERREVAFRAFEAAFDGAVAALVGILREPKPKSTPARKRSPWWHDTKRCPVCAAPVVVRYVGGRRCEQCGRAMPASTTKPRRYCGGSCQRAASRQRFQTNRRSSRRA